MALEESASDDDEIIEQSGVQFLVKNKDQAYLDHAKIDYVKNVFGQGQYLVLRI
ncbi:iron-sulfur cluster biosynthesis family protein [Schinkia sp. CFF1]